MRERILVTGANGQLGQCLQKLAPQFALQYEFLFVSSSELDITDASIVESVLDEFKPNYCINCAAYTAVDLAEKEESKAFEINAYGVRNLAQACKELNAILLHVSTDYVFSGDTEISYDEESFTAPIGVYGKSKLLGEELALEENPKTIVVRTSWLYSEFNKNFVKTMLSLFAQKEELSIVGDQMGQPTNANDLAEALMAIIAHPEKKFGIYHFSNFPETSWFYFAKEIAALSGATIQLKEITTAEYPTPAARPKRSTMALDKIEKDYGITPKYWQNSLQECIAILKEE